MRRGDARSGRVLWRVVFVAIAALVAWLALHSPESERSAGTPPGGSVRVADAPSEVSDGTVVAPQAVRTLRQGTDLGERRTDEAPGGTAVLVLDPEGRPAAGAPVWRSELPGDHRQAGVTDARGLLRIWPIEHPTELRSHTSEAYGILALGAPEPGIVARQLVLELQPGTRISGTLVDFRGRPLGAGIEVLAFPAELTQSGPRALERALASRGDVLRTTSDAEGRFELRGLPPEQRWTLRAAGAGHLLQSPAVAESGDLGLELRLLPVFVLSLDLVHADGSPASISPQLTTIEAESAELRAPELRVHPHVSHAARANGLDLYERGELPVHRRLFLMSAAVDAAAGIPVRYKARFPGFAPAEINVQAVGAAEFSAGAAVLLELEPTGAGFGELLLIADGSTPGSLTELPAGELRLSGLGRAETFTVPADPTGLVQLRDLPDGTYAARFRVHHGLLSWPAPGELAPRVTIGPAPADLHLESRPAGTLQLLPTSADGRPFAGTLTVGLVAEENVHPDEAGGLELAQVSVITLEQPPYLVTHVPPGDYYLDLMAPASSAAGQLIPLRVEDAASTQVPLEGLLR